MHESHALGRGARDCCAVVHCCGHKRDTSSCQLDYEVVATEETPMVGLKGLTFDFQVDSFMHFKIVLQNLDSRLDSRLGTNRQPSQP